MTKLTAATADLLRRFRSEAFDDNETGMGTFGLFEGDLTAAERGNLTDLKKKGLVVGSGQFDRNDNGRFEWCTVDMTAAVSTEG